MRIRVAKVEDAQAICDVHVAAIREVCAAHYEPVAVQVWIAGKRAERYVAVMASNVMLVAEMAGELVGFGNMHVESGEIRAVYVRPDRLRRGVGAALLRGSRGSAASIRCHGYICGRRSTPSSSTEHVAMRLTR